MFYALVHYPSLASPAVAALRRKYDPQANLIAPHITLVFPLPEAVGEAELIAHIQQGLAGQGPFPIRLQGLEQSWDDYLFLRVQEGRAEIARLHDALYTGLLAPYHRKDIPYTPHVTLGAFAGQPARCAQALQEAEWLDLQFWCVADRLNLVKINDERTHIVSDKEFLLMES